ncbi:rod-binding protein [Spirochaeta dissipatitropha]
MTVTSGIDVDFTRFLSQPKVPSGAENASGMESDKLREVTREFEALFVKQMLDSMYSTLSPEDGLFYGGQSENIFRDMLNMEYAREMSFSGTFGLADSMYDQLSRNQQSAAYNEMSNSLE